MARLAMFLSAFLVLTGPVLSAGNLPTSTVRVQSQLSERNDGKHLGSGLLFYYDGKYYVLTSEHVVLHGNRGINHSVWNKAQGVLKARLLVADWGVGLALLEVLSPIKDNHIPYLSDLFPKEVREQDSVVVAGYPRGTTTLIADDHGYVLAVDSERHLLPQVSKALEIKGAHGEFGMSGGPIFSKDQSHVLGVLSHQYLTLVRQSSSAIAEFTSEAQLQQDHLIAIPATAVALWLSAYFAHPTKFLPSFVKDPALQVEGISTIFGGGLKFELEKLPLDRALENPVGGPDGVGKKRTTPTGKPGEVGGPDGVGHKRSVAPKLDEIGGADGVGRRFQPSVPKSAEIGGGLAGSSEKEEIAAVRISFDRGDHHTRWSLAKKADWLRQVEASVKIVGQKVRVPFFVERDAETGVLEGRVYFASLSEFFKLLALPDREPVTLLTAVKGVDAQQALIKELRDKARALRQQCAAIDKVGTLTGEGGRLLDQIQLIADLAGSESENWKLVNAKDIERLLKAEDDGWQSLMDQLRKRQVTDRKGTDRVDEEVMNESVDLLKRLNELQNILAQLKF